MTEKTIYQIALNVAINQTFSYQADIKESECNPKNLVGHLVLVSFGKKAKQDNSDIKVGLVIQKANQDEKKRIEDKNIKIKPIVKVLSSTEVLSQVEIDWLIELSNYYHQPIGKMVFQALAKGYKTHPQFIKTINQKQLGFLNYWKINNQNEKNNSLSKSQKELVNQINDEFKNGIFNQLDVKKLNQYTKAKFDKLISLDLVQKHQFDFSKPVDRLKIKLTKEQQAIKQKIASKLNSFSIDLIYGDTATGKTEIYIKLIQEVLKKKQQILYLVPEIGLVNQVVKRIEQSTNLPVLAIHSNLTENEHHQIYRVIQTGEFSILVGTRSSAFFSFKNLGLIIIDEEHDHSYKQIEKLHYSAKEMLFLKARKLSIPIVMGSATPSLEMIKLGIEKKIQTHRLIKTNQINERNVHLIDMKPEAKDCIFSLSLLRMIESQLNQGKQCLLFLNRRGYAPMLKCINCNWSMYCDDCDSAMVYHQFDQLMHCHHCKQKKTAAKQCPVCAYKPLKMVGSGTEKLEELLKKQFKDTKIWRVDRDNIQKKNAMTGMIDSIESEQSGIIIGTQILSKGHDFSNVSLVAIIDVDWYLIKSDIDSQQKLSQLFIQVMGRAGRKKMGCDIVLQTKNPENPLIQNLIDQGYDGFLNQAINQTKKYSLPPFAFQSACMASSQNRQKLYQFLSDWRNQLLNYQIGESVEIWQIEPSPIEKKSNRYYAYFLIYSKNRSDIHQLLHLSVKEIIPKLKIQNQVRYYFDVNCTGIDF